LLAVRTGWLGGAYAHRAFYIVQENTKEIWLLSVKHKDETDDYIKRGYQKDISLF